LDQKRGIRGGRKKLVRKMTQKCENIRQKKANRQFSEKSETTCAGVGGEKKGYIAILLGGGTEEGEVGRGYF